METPIERLKRLSAELVSELDDCSVEQLDAYMAEREQIFAELMSQHQELLPAERDIAKQIVAMDKQIVAKIVQFRDSATAEMDKLQRSQQSRNAYENIGYAGYQDESYFFDRRR